MVSLLNEIAQKALDTPLTQPQELGSLLLRLAENYHELAENTRVAQSLMSTPELGQKLKVGVQKLGTVCIELVKLGGQRRSYPEDKVLKK